MAKQSSKIYVVGKCEMHREEQDVLEKLKKIDHCNMGKFGTLGSSDKTIAVLRWETDGGYRRRNKKEISKTFLCRTWKKSNERPKMSEMSPLALQ